MKNRILLMLILALAASVLTGCVQAGSGSSPLKREVEALKMDVENLKSDRNLSEMGGRGGGGAMNTELGQLRADVQRLTDNMDMAVAGQNLTLRQQLEYVNLRLDRLEKQAKLSPLSPQAVASTSEPASGYNNSSQAVPVIYPNDPPVSAPATGQGDAPLASGAKSSFEEGKLLYDRRDYDGALAKFRAYMGESAKGNQAAAAQFYIGESLSAQKKYEEAILEYQKVVQDYPKSSQVPSALLKQGAAFQSLNDKSTAKLLYQKVAQEFPKSYAAGVAKERLKTM